jgi:hypothetical protein
LALTAPPATASQSEHAGEDSAAPPRDSREDAH